MSRCDRLEFAAENQVGYGTSTEVIIKEKAQNTLHKYKLQLNEIKTYQEIWSEDLPHGVNTASIIGAMYSWIDGETPLLHDKSTSTTLVLSSDGRKILDNWHHEGVHLTTFGSVVGLKQVYAVEKTSGEYEIVIVHADRSETKLQPLTAKPTWSHPCLSVSQFINKRHIAVTSKDRTLDIYGRSFTRECCCTLIRISLTMLINIEMNSILQHNCESECPNAHEIRHPNNRDEHRITIVYQFH